MSKHLEYELNEEELAELRLMIERVSDEFANRIVRRYHSLTSNKPNLNIPIAPEPDPLRKGLMVVEKDRMGKPISWVYGPYNIGAAVFKPGWAYASLDIGAYLFGQSVYDVLPTEIEAVPMELLLNKIDKAVVLMKKKVKDGK